MRRRAGEGDEIPSEFLEWHACEVLGLTLFELRQLSYEDLHKGLAWHQGKSWARIAESQGHGQRES